MPSIAELRTETQPDWLLARPGAEHPAANLLRKQEKSSTLSTGGRVLLSQLAKVCPAAKALRKQAKSSTLSQGTVVEWSQLA